MCLAIPGRVVKVMGEKAEVDFFGVRRKVNIGFVTVKKDDYVLVFGGNVLEVIDKESAEEILKGLG